MERSNMTAKGDVRVLVVKYPGHGYERWIRVIPEELVWDHDVRLSTWRGQEHKRFQTAEFNGRNVACVECSSRVPATSGSRG